MGDPVPSISTIAPVSYDKPHIAIVYNRPSGIFKTRDYIEGSVVISAPDPITLRGILVKCKGKATVFWEVGSGNHRKQHVNSEKYFNILQQVVGQSNDTTCPAVSLPAGEYNFPFSVSIPTNIPSSFESRFASVRYSCAAILELVKYGVTNGNQPVKKYKEKVPFTIKNVLDINAVPNGKDAVYFEGSKPMYAMVCCWNMGYLSGKIKINQSAFVPKDKIMVSVEVRNTTMEPLRIFEVSLKKLITYSNKAGNSITDPYNQTVCFAGTNGVQDGTERCTISAAKQLRIPKQIPPTNLGGGCSIIHVSYYLKFLLSLSSVESPNTSMRINIPIVIGTEDSSLRRNQAISEPVYPQPIFPAFPPNYEDIVGVHSSGLTRDDHNLPALPPSYDEATSPRTELGVA